MTLAVDAAMMDDITQRLKDIETEENAKILLAIESGSRAWGFDSPDSDYDVRFFYARSIDWHLSVTPGRDVIERPISDDLDISGWDLRKTLGLIMGSNAVALEWLHSPITYIEQTAFRDDLLAFAKQTLRRKPVTWHYIRLAERQTDRLQSPDGQIKLKRYFYIVRPTLALRWLRLHPQSSTPPMDMQALMDETDLPEALEAAIQELVARKKALSEMGMTRKTPDTIDALIKAEIAAAQASVTTRPDAPMQSVRAEADNLLRRWTRWADQSMEPARA